MIVISVLSFLLLLGFIILSGILNRGIPGSYSAFSSVWAEDLPKLNVWSVVTFIVAFGMTPPMIQAGDGNAVQFLGFFAPLYLIVVSLTPNWDIDKRQGRIHTIGAIACAVIAFAWLLLIRHHWWVILICLAAASVAGWRTKTLPGSIVFWGEMIMFASVYLSIWIGS